jgi:hypothetical protein
VSILNTLRAIWQRVFKRTTVKLLWRIGKTQGLRGISLRAGILLRQGFAYQRWVSIHDSLTDADRLAISHHIQTLSYRPLISVLLPTFDTPEIWLRKAIDSVRQQCYSNWELCIADDASVAPHVARVLLEYAQQDSRIRIILRPDNGHISVTTNSALAMAQGDFVALLDHDDELARHALYLVAVNLNANPRYDMLYSDEDKMDTQGRRFDPYFKPDWNPALLESQNMVSHLGVYRTALLRQIGGFRLGVEGCQDWDVALRISERTTAQNICHIPFVLYHWRTVAGSTAIDHGQKGYIKCAAFQVVREHMARLQQGAEVVSSFGSFVCPLPGYPKPKPRVSVIVFGTEPHPEITTVNTIWPELEVMHCTPLDGESRANFINRIAQRVKGDLLCLLQSQLLPAHTAWLGELVRQACRPGVGAVGPMQLDPDGNICHAAIVLCAHAGETQLFQSLYQGLDGAITGIAGRAGLTQNVSALAPGCLLLPTAAFWQVGGLDAIRYPHFHFELDLCLRLAECGFKNVWTPRAKMINHQSDRVGGITAEAEESARFRAQWQRMLDYDPSFNPNLAKGSVWPTPAFPPRTDIPWLPFKSQKFPQRALP